MKAPCPLHHRSHSALRAALLAPLSLGSVASLATVSVASASSPAIEPEEATTASAEAGEAALIPGFDTLEHRFGLALGAARVAQLGLGVASWRADYTLAWRGWGIGVGAGFSLQADQAAGVGAHLRRSVLLGPGRLCGTLELGVTRLQWGTQGDRTAILYHGTSSGLELAYELGRATTLRPFLALRAELPWYTTEIETLKPESSADGAPEITSIDYRREWTPLYGAWVGIAL